MLNKMLLLFIGISGFMGVAFGAISAHIIKDADAIGLIEKASLYQLIHTLALLALRNEHSQLIWCVQLCWMTGIVLFSGSLYLKAFAITQASSLAPFGGTLLMAGWLILTAKALYKKF